MDPTEHLAEAYFRGIGDGLCRRPEANARSGLEVIVRDIFTILILRIFFVLVVFAVLFVYFVFVFFSFVSFNVFAVLLLTNPYNCFRWECDAIGR